MNTQIQPSFVSDNSFSGGQKTAVLITLLAIVLILGIYHETIESIVAIWNRSETYAHGYLIVPFCIYMIWKKRPVLTSVDYRPGYVPLLILAGLGAGWLMAAAASVQVAEQYALVAMIPIIVWAILGWNVFSTIIFPLAYLLFAVPFGEVFIPPLIDFTADFTVNALQFVGMPVYREGSFFSIPSGNWSVVEACSGVRYLIASVTLGTLYAYLTYRSVTRRFVFIVCSILVPIIANGMRAFLIVMTGHLSGMRLAVGVDHLIYGWVFFGLVMLLLFWLGSFWREDHLPVISDRDLAESDQASSTVPIKTTLGMGVLVVAVAAVWPVYLHYLNNKTDIRPIPEISITDPSGKWKIDPTQFSDWIPGYVGFSRQFIGHFQHENQHIGLYITYYRNQQQTGKLISTGNVLVAEKNSGWRNISGDTRKIALGATELSVNENVLHAASDHLLIWRWFWLIDQETDSSYRGKVIQAVNRILGKGDDGAEIMVAAAYEHNPEEAVSVLREFIADMKPVITESLQAVQSESTRD